MAERFIGQTPRDFGITRVHGYQGFRIPPIPGDGWISHIHVAYDSVDSGGQDGRWGIHASQGEVIYASPTVNFPNTQNVFIWRTHTIANPVRVSAGQYYPGVLHDESMSFIADSNNMAQGSGQNWYELIGWSNTVPSDIIPSGVGYLPTAQVGVTFSEQLIPRKPHFVSPTPNHNATSTDTTPEIRFAILHDDVYDSSKLVDIELTVVNTNVFWHWIYAVNATQNRDNQFGVTPAITFAPGDIISVRVRHQDTWDDWSEWSDTRVFSIFDAAPGKGVWRAPTPAENSLVHDSTPNISGTTPHPGADSAYDLTNGVQVEVIDNDTNEVIQQTIFGPSPQDRAGKVFNYTLAEAIPANTNARLRFRHHDIKGTWSEWSDARNFSMSAGPDLPTVTRPLGKVNYRNQTEYQAQGGTGFLYAGTYNNPTATPMHSVRIEIWNGDGSARLYDSNWVATTATGGTWSLSQASFPGHPAALAWGTSYKIRANVAEQESPTVMGVESGWGEFTDFRTNSFPDRPSALSPADGVASPTLTFTASATDPDGDAITEARMTVIRLSNNQTVVNDQTMTVTGTQLSKTLTAGTLVLGERYQWFCKARDATGFGVDSFPEEFLYASVPAPTMLAPRLTERVNLVRDPSAEYESAAEGIAEAPYWTTSGTDALNFIERTDEAALYGRRCWKATTSDANGLILTSEAHPIALTQPYLLQAEFKKLDTFTDLPAKLRFRVQPLDSSGNPLGSALFPASIRTSAGGVDVPTSWTRFGGIIWHNGSANSPKWPTGTTQARIEIMPSDDAASEVYFDAICFEQVAATIFTPAQFLDVQQWYGYFDGDIGIANEALAPFYYFSGEVGSSRSRGEARLTTAGSNAKVYFTFTHTSAIVARRLLIERYSSALEAARGPSAAWVQIYDSGFESIPQLFSGAVASINMPQAVIRNDERFRISIALRDNILAGVSGYSAPTIADTDYIGQPEPQITQITSDPSRAEVGLSWSQTTLADAAFGGYEIARLEPDGSYQILHREMNKNLLSYTDYFPLSDTDYIYLVRVVELVGIDEQQGRWGRAPMSVNYFPNSFIKDVENPQNLYVAFESAFESMPTPEEDAVQEILVPWGSARPMVLTRSDMRLRSGTITANFYKDNVTVEDAMIRYKKMLSITNRRRTVCLLLQEPDRERIFASVMGPVSKRYTGVEQRSIEFAYQENSYIEDIREAGTRG